MLTSDFNSIIDKNIIRFKRDTAFRKQFFVPDSFAHPAKMDAQLLIWIVEHYTEAGETILDPMAGSGTTMLACGLGRNVILVELEERFCKMMRDNWEQVRMRPQLGSTMGTCQIIQGDARQLENIPCDKIISSPPYSDISMGGGLNTKPSREGHADQSGRSPNSPSQRGLVDKIISSPPYAEGVSAHKQMEGQVTKGYFKGIITKQKEPMKTYETRALPEDPGNIGNLPYGNIDSIITSPPYENAITGKETGIDWSKGTRGKAEGNKPRDKSKEPAFGHLAGFGMPLGYSENRDNIGNLKSTSYLDAMKTVYSECYKVLKPQGLMVLVCKNFIRNQKEIRLDLDTIKLCETAGFTFIERWYRELPAQSFWRVIYKKKFPDAPELKYEDVLIFGK